VCVCVCVCMYEICICGAGKGRGLIALLNKCMLKWEAQQVLTSFMKVYGCMLINMLSLTNQRHMIIHMIHNPQRSQMHQEGNSIHSLTAERMAKAEKGR